jgi:DNA-binding CsgD family transcriptional regulator
MVASWPMRRSSISITRMTVAVSPIGLNSTIRSAGRLTRATRVTTATWRHTAPQVARAARLDIKRRLLVDTGIAAVYLDRQGARRWHGKERPLGVTLSDATCGSFSGGGMAKGDARGGGTYRDVRVTVRQAEILDLAARDLSDKQIAGRLGISVATVRTQWQRFYKANGLHGRAGAVAAWLRCRRAHFWLQSRRPYH